MLSPKHLKYMHSDKHGPRKSSNHDQYPHPIWHCPMCDDQPAMSADGRRYDAVPVGVRVSVEQRRCSKRSASIVGRGGRDSNCRVVRTAKRRRRAAVGYRFEVAFRGESGRRPRGGRLLPRALAQCCVLGCQLVVPLQPWLWGNMSLQVLGRGERSRTGYQWVHRCGVGLGKLVPRGTVQKRRALSLVSGLGRPGDRGVTPWPAYREILQSCAEFKGDSTNSQLWSAW